MKTIAFSVPIFKYKVKNWNVKKNQLINLFNNVRHDIIVNVIASPFNIKTNILLDEIKIFEKDIGLDLISTEVWFQQYKHDMDHEAHDHGPFGFSSVCFIEYDKNYHKPTTFISPFSNSITGEFEEYEPDVQEGDILFFPSNLRHYAPPNISNLTRTVMSFNLQINNKHSKLMVDSLRDCQISGLSYH
tara:strand:- start:890 stop:1453 length:564 start_codon:yes stop_codon:yes gene_type:complete